MANGNLQTIFDYAYPSNHLLRISIVKNSEEASSKSPYFALITIMPGVNNPNTGTRTYDSNSKIVMKQSVLHFLAIAKGLKRLCKYGQQNFIGHTTFMTDASRSNYGGNEQKILYLSRTMDKDNNMLITIGMKIGQNPAKAINLTPAIAESIADTIEEIAKMTLKLELEEIRQRLLSNYQNNQQRNINQQPPPTNVPFDSGFSNQNNMNQTPQQTPFVNDNIEQPPTNVQFDQSSQQNNNAIENVTNNFIQTLNNQNVPFDIGDTAPF